jgi:hypothetical protein
VQQLVLLRDVLVLARVCDTGANSRQASKVTKVEDINTSQYSAGAAAQHCEYSKRHTDAAPAVKSHLHPCHPPAPGTMKLPNSSPRSPSTTWSAGSGGLPAGGSVSPSNRGRRSRKCVSVRCTSCPAAQARSSGPTSRSQNTRSTSWVQRRTRLGASSRPPPAWLRPCSAQHQK